LLVPGGRWQTVMTMPSSFARAWLAAVPLRASEDAITVNWFWQMRWPSS
jgi:hypothetical protein